MIFSFAYAKCKNCGDILNIEVDNFLKIIQEDFNELDIFCEICNEYNILVMGRCCRKSR